VISRRHLPFIEQAIVTALQAWTEEPRILRHDRFRMLLHDCLMPQFRVFRPVGPDISAAADQLLELTETQAQVFEGLYAQDRVLVEGVAGSGKTFLALLRALAFAREGRRTLFVCFNKELAAWIRRQVEEDPDTECFRALLTVKNFHALAADLAEEANIEFRPAGGGQFSEAFWDDEVPDLLEQAVLALDVTGQPVHFDAVVVDEAQDFSVGWWYALTQSLLRASDGPVYAFMDPNQSLRGEVQLPPVEFDARFLLKINCRNTRRIAAASASVLDLEPRIFARAPVGSQPRLLRASTPRQQKGLVLQELKKLIQREDVAPRQLAVIGPAAKGNGSLADVTEIEGVPLVTSADEWRSGGGVLVTTARSFKGLEADVVLLYDLGDFGRLFRKEDLYVACTRARVLLIAIVHGSECRAVINAAFAASETQL
jgi:superfamily I DNA/RNA helicase